MFCLHYLLEQYFSTFFYIMKKVDEFIEEIRKSRRGHDLSEDDVDEHKSDML